MNFNKNEEYHIFKEPNGKQFAKKVDQLVMILTFILLQKQKDSFLVLTNFKNQIKGLNILNNENDIKLYLRFLLEFYDRKNLVETNEKIEKEKTMAYLCCCLGFLSVEYFIRVKNSIMNKASIDDFIEFLKQKNTIIDTILSNDTLYECFKNGIYYIIYCCLNNFETIDCLIPLLQVLIKVEKLVSVSEISEKFSTHAYLCSPKCYIDKKDRLKNQMNKIDKEKTEIMKFLIEVCPDWNAFFVSIEILNDDKCFKEIILNKKCIIKDRILNSTGDISKEDMNFQYEEYKKHKELLNDFIEDFSLYFIKICPSSRQLIQIVKDGNFLNSKNPILLNQFLSTAIKMSGELPLMNILKILNVYNCDNIKQKDSKIKSLENQFRNIITDKVRLIKPPFKDMEINNLKNAMESNFLFPTGVQYQSFFDENFISKLSVGHAKQIMIEILIKNQNACPDLENWKGVFIKILAKTIDYNINDEIINTVSEIFKVLNETVVKLNDKDGLPTELFKEFLLLLYKVDDIDLFINLINYSQLYLNEKFEENYIKFVKEKIFDKLKNRDCKEINSLIDKILRIIRIDHQSKIKGKMLAAIFAYASNYEETTNSIKDILFFKPNRDHFFYRIINYSNFYPDLNNAPIVSNLKFNIRNVIENFLLKRKFLAEEVLDMKKLKHDEEKLKITAEYVKSAYYESLESVPDAKTEILKTIKIFDKLTNEINMIQEVLDFIKPYLKSADDCINNLRKCKELINKSTIELIRIPDDCLKLLELSMDYKIFKNSNCFAVCFSDVLSDNEKHEKQDILKDINFKHKTPLLHRFTKQLFETVIDENSTQQIKKESESSSESGQDDLLTIDQLAEKFVKTQDHIFSISSKIFKDENLRHKFFEKYFSRCITDDLIKSEIKILKDILEKGGKTMILDKKLEFCKTSIKNNNEISKKQTEYKSILKCFQIFEIHKGIITENLTAYLNLISKGEFEILELNNLVVRLDNNLNDVLNSKYLDIVKEIIQGLSKSEKLIEYLSRKNEEDIRNLIDIFDEHGDDHIRVQNIIELCKIIQFLRKIDHKNGELSFLKSIITIIETTVESEESVIIRNMSAIIETSNNIIDNLKLIIETLQNREEASKIKILELGQNAVFEIEFKNNIKKFNLKTSFRKKRELTLSDLSDLRDRALLMLNNQKTAQDYIGDENNNMEIISDDNLEESKRISDIFIRSINLLYKIVNCLNLNYENGYPMNELYNHFFLKIENENDDDIRKFDEEISKIGDKWNETLNSALKECQYLSFFWGREIFTIESYLRNPDYQSNFKKLINHLYYANSNIYSFKREDLAPYPEVKDKTPFERVNILAEYLSKLFVQIPEEKLIRMNAPETMNDRNDDYNTNNNQIIYIKIDARNYLNALLICNRDLIGYYPSLNQLLFCNSSTTWPEIKSFLFRISKSNQKLFTMIGCERLNFELQDLFFEYFHKLFKDYNPECLFRLAIISHDDRNHIFNNLNHLSDQNIKLVKFQNYKDILNKPNISKQLVRHWKKNITIVTSNYGGLGKSTIIENEVKKNFSKNFRLLKYPISDCESFLVTAERLSKIFSDSEEKDNTIMHFDVSYSNNDETLNEFLFQIALLNIFKINDYIFITPSFQHFYIEISNTHENYLKNQIYFEQLISNVIHIDKFSMNDLIIGDMNKCTIQELLKNPPSSNYRLNIQIVCNYFQQLENNTVNKEIFSIKKETVELNDKKILNSMIISCINNTVILINFPNMKILDKESCVYLIDKYFIQKLNKPNQESLSFIKLRNFINLLGYYLLKFSENGFITAETLSFITSSIQDNTLKIIIQNIRKQIVNTLIDLSIMGVTQSVNAIEKNQNVTLKRLRKHNNDDENQVEEQAIMDQIVNFENCKYLMIMFGENTDHIGLIYSDISLITSNLLSIFKSQNFEKLKAIGQNKFLDYIRDDTDKSVFINYREQSHQNLFEKLKEIFNFNDEPVEYKIDLAKFPNISSTYKDNIENLNKKIGIIANKLNNYVLSPDNFLKIILIHHKLKSNLPVVIMGETGVGKTSLISYMALKLLKTKFLVFNIHAGITQKSFLDQLDLYFLIADTYCTESLWIFFDEFNTSECMYLINEMICNSTILGKFIPLNIKIFAACNPYKLKSKKVDAGLVIKRQSTMLLHAVYPIPANMIQHIWDFGALKENDEKNYIASMLKSLKFTKLDLVCELIFVSQNFVRNIEEVSSVSLRDVDRFRLFFKWFYCNIKKRENILNILSNEQHFENKCIILSIFMCYFLRLSTKKHRTEYTKLLSNVFKNYKVDYSDKYLNEQYENEQDEYLSRLNLPKGIACNNVLRENVFAALVCIMNKIPMFICGKPGCSKTLSIQLLTSSLRGKESLDLWFRSLPGIFTVTYQGSESSTSEGIYSVFEKAKQIAFIYSSNNPNNTVIPLIVFDEMGLAEISKNNPLKVLHSLLEIDNIDIAFVGISNWRLDASKMNRGIFLARPDLSKEDLENTAEVIFKSYIIQQDIDYTNEIEMVKVLAQAYFNYKEKLKNSNHSEFHGARDFYYLIKQVSEKLVSKKIQNEEELLSVIQIALERNFEGLKEKFCNIKQEFRQCYKKIVHFERKISILDLIKMNLNDKNSRYLMLIIKSDSTSFILDNFLSNHVKNRITFVGSKFEEDLTKEEYSFRTLSDIILYMEKGWPIIMQDMDHIYSSLYDLFNQHFIITGGNKKNCRIALGSVINPMCFVHDEFHCIIMVQEEFLSRCEPPFLNRFEKYYLSFETIITDKRLEMIKEVKNWIENLLNFHERIEIDQNSKINMGILIANYTEETIASLIFYYFNKIENNDSLSDHQKCEFVIKNSKLSLIKICSNFSLLMATQSVMMKKNKNEVKFFVEYYSKIFKKSSNLRAYLQEMKEPFKSIVYTFDSVTKSLNLEDIQFEETKIGYFNSEKHLYQTISNFYRSSCKRLLIVRFEWEEHAQHLNLLKFLIDKVEIDNSAKIASKKKSICILIHTNIKMNEQSYKILNKYKLSFLSTYDQIMIDNLDDKMIEISDILFLPIDQLIVEEKILKFNEAAKDLIMSSINKLKYVDSHAIFKMQEFEKNIYEYKKNLVKSFSSNHGPFMKLLSCFQNNIFKTIKESSNSLEFKDWRLQILTDRTFLELTFDIKLMLKHFISNMITYPFVDLLYVIEKYFPFESLVSQPNDPLKSEIFFEVLNQELNENNQTKAKNANQANEIVAYFNLKLPFIRKECEMFEKIPEMEETIGTIISIEQLLDPEIKIYNQNLNKIRELAKFFKKTVESKSIFYKFINQGNKQIICENYLHDIVVIKYHKYFGMQEILIDFLTNTINALIKINNEEFDLPSIYYNGTKLMHYVQKLFEIFKSFKSVFDDDIKKKIITTLIKIDLNENIKKIEHLFVETLVNAIFCELIQKIDDIQLEQFPNLFIEIVGVKIQYGIAVKIYNASFFMSELIKLLLKINKKNPDVARKLAIEVVNIIKGKIENNEFLKDSNCIQAIINVINKNMNVNSQHDIDKTQDKDDIDKFKNFLFGLTLEENKGTNILRVFFDEFCKNEHSIKSAGPILEKLIIDTTVDFELNFLSDENKKFSFLEILDKKFSEIGIDSELAIVFAEVLYNNLEFDKDPEENFDEFVKENEKLIINLYRILQNFEFKFQTELISKIEFKNIAYLTSIAFLKRLILIYCQELLNNVEIHDKYYLQLFDKILSEDIMNPNSKVSNSLSTLALRIINKTLCSYSALKDFVCSNYNLKWQSKLKFVEPKGLLDISLISDKMENKILEYGNLIIDIIRSNGKDVDKIKDFQDKLLMENPLIEDLSLVFLLSVFNSIYSQNTHKEFFENNKSKSFKDCFEAYICKELKNDNSCFIYLVENIINNFPANRWLQASPTMNINDLKLISIIMNFSSIISSFYKSNNSFTCLFYEKNGNQIKDFQSKKKLYWIVTPDSEEFEILNSLKNYQFQSYSDEDIAKNRW
jgi:hypothetical protein